MGSISIVKTKQMSHVAHWSENTKKVRGVVEYAKGWKVSVVREFVKMWRKCSIHGKCEKCEKYEYYQNPINMPLDLTRYAAFGVFVGFPKVM